MSGASEKPESNAEIFGRLGYIIREFHDALREIGADRVIAEAAIEFPSARERLLHIGRLTEKAANTVLSKVEETSPIQNSIAAEAKRLGAEWDKLPAPSQGADLQESLVEQTRKFLKTTESGCSITVDALSEMMMAQDFQDLTGQLIKKVVAVMEQTENDLLRLLIDAAPVGTMSTVKEEEVMAGPGAPGSIALEQTDVDDLLADLGF